MDLSLVAVWSYGNAQENRRSSKTLAMVSVHEKFHLITITIVIELWRAAMRAVYQLMAVIKLRLFNVIRLSVR